MLHYIYRWRYKRAQKAQSFKVPSDREGYKNGRVTLGNYLSQSSVRGRSFSKFDLPRKRRSGLMIIIIIVTVIVLSWLVIESVAALELLRN